jgi:hypothetical protein
MLTKAIALFQLRDIREIKTDRTQLELIDFIKVKSDLKYLLFVQDNFQNCSDLDAIKGGRAGVRAAMRLQQALQLQLRAWTGKPTRHTSVHQVTH